MPSSKPSTSSATLTPASSSDNSAVPIAFPSLSIISTVSIKISSLLPSSVSASSASSPSGGLSSSPSISSVFSAGAPSDSVGGSSVLSLPQAVKNNKKASTKTSISHRFI